MSAHYYFGSSGITLSDLSSILNEKKRVALSEEAVKNINRSHNFLNEKLDNKHHPNYGINTGFGKLCDIAIPPEQLKQLQVNLIRSHACGAGDLIPDEICDLLILLKIQNLCMGYSGVSLELVEALVQLHNSGIRPLIYTQGSLGASGDLAPLSHMSLALLGEGEVHYNGEKMPASVALRKSGLKPVSLKPKEGLALINGTQFCAAYAAWCIHRTEKLLAASHLSAAASWEAFAASYDPLTEKLHRIRNQKGQYLSASVLREILEGSDHDQRHKYAVQDPYSFRCTPQVLGASIDGFNYAREITARELCSVTDNPNILIDEDRIVSGGNFHAQPLALALDFLAIAVAEIASISERRTYLLTAGERDLPIVLTEDSGLQSGLMIPQYTAAAIVSQNKQLCTPASVDSIISSLGQEDHVSMGANAATKCYQVVKNAITVVGIEWLTATQALEFRSFKVAPKVHAACNKFRQVVPKLTEDRILYTDMEAAAAFIMDYDINNYLSEVNWSETSLSPLYK
jgi:histidine ammonia-lyase